MTFNPYPVGESVTRSEKSNAFFGLIESNELNQMELHGYEVTLSGRLVLPELRTQVEMEEQKLVNVILC